MAYATTTGMDQKFGDENITKWSDLDNDGDTDNIAARKAAAIVAADAEVNTRLGFTHYRKPFVTTASATPAIIADIANALAGCWLKDARDQETYDDQGEPRDSVTWHRTKAYKMIDQIISGQIRLDAL